MSPSSMLAPDSVAWRVHRDPSSMVGGIRSLIVQALQPRAMAGVAQHGSFRQDFWGRLRRTNDFLMTVVYGSSVEAERAAAVVRSVHARVVGFDHFTRREYRADEPELLTWVQNSTVDSYLAGFRRHGGLLSSVDADRYVSEMRVLGELMGLDREDLPSREGELREYFTGYAPKLEASPDAKEAVRVLLNPDLPLHIKPLWSLPAADAYASIPAAFKRMYGLPWFAPAGAGLRVGTFVLLRSFNVLLPPPPIVEKALADAASQVA